MSGIVWNCLVLSGIVWNCLELSCVLSLIKSSQTTLLLSKFFCPPAQGVPACPGLHVRYHCGQRSPDPFSPYEAEHELSHMIGIRGRHGTTLELIHQSWAKLRGIWSVYRVHGTICNFVFHTNCSSI